MSIGTALVRKPGNYIFAKLNSAGKWVPVYIGETGDLSERFDHHHAAACFNRNGASHIHAHISSNDRSTRLAEETDLRQNYTTACNNQ
jgi:predicted GIY-YIG superfamily endonuclease